VKSITEGHIELDNIVAVEVDGLAEWAAKNDASKLVPYINGRPIAGNYPEAILPSKNHLQFHFDLMPENPEPCVSQLPLAWVRKGLVHSIRFLIRTTG
jgi:hypothetical protein